VKKISFLLIFINVWFLQAQKDSLRYCKNSYIVSDTISYYHVSTNPYFFKVSTKSKPIDSLYYNVDFSKSKLFLKPIFFRSFSPLDSISIEFYKYPDFLTKTYQKLNPSLIIDNKGNPNRISIEKSKKNIRGKPLEGLDTQGNIIRGITVGNNQDAVLNSVLDLKIEGQLSSKVSLRARINDTNIPIQENGYSQDLKDIDRVYIEMLGPKWNIRAGDVFLKDSTSYFMHFNKKVSGVAIESYTDKWHTYASGALVRGRYTSYKFQGEETNQGPYKLSGSNGEAYIFIIQGSEKVYINGILQTRGENKDYIINYYTAEITFTPTRPITSDMRVLVEFQYSDRNYSRFVTHESINYSGDKWDFGISYFNESDLKNQALQVNLSDEQIKLLSEVGNNTQQMFVTKAIESDYKDDKILYRRTTISGKEVYEYSKNQNDTLYQVGFTYFGENQGDYHVLEYLAIGKKMEYVGDNQGDYKAIIPLIAPSKQQIVLLQSHYKPNNKTNFSVEMAYADNDANLFSKIDNDQNQAPALKTTWKQIFIDSTKNKWQLESDIRFFYQNQRFKSIERLNKIEFNRDWNIQHTDGDQRLLVTKILLTDTNKSRFYYTFENLNYTKTYNGIKHGIGVAMQIKNFNINHLTSYLDTKGLIDDTRFIRTNTAVKYNLKKWWIASKFDFENNKQFDKNTSAFNLKSYQFADLETLLGVGDSAKVNVELGAQFHTNDSLVNTNLQRVNDSKTWFVKSQLINKENANLNIYLNYRIVNYREKSTNATLNSRINYRQQLFKQFLIWSTQYQNTSGNIPQHEYTYVETEIGQGFYTWFDYDQDGVKDLDEFEIAQYADQANYLRIALPNISYVPTHEVKLQQKLHLNFSKWKQEKGIKKIIAHFGNQFSILVENNRYRTGDLINYNPFNKNQDNLVSKQFILRNSLYFNRGLANYSTMYNYIKTEQRTLQTFGNQENTIEKHQLAFTHRIKENWQIGLSLNQSINNSQNEVFSKRNYRISEQKAEPNISYFINKNHWFKTSYIQANKRNKIGNLESLNQNQIAFKYQYTGKEKSSISLELKGIKNQFAGTSFSAVAYKMLEGLQPDNNYTWSLLWSYKLNSFLYINLNYNGRTNSLSKTIHNGTVQLRAGF
jgi:hypothetical protein